MEQIRLMRVYILDSKRDVTSECNYSEKFEFCLHNIEHFLTLTVFSTLILILYLYY